MFGSSFSACAWVCLAPSDIDGAMVSQSLTGGETGRQCRLDLITTTTAISAPIPLEMSTSHVKH